MAQKLPDPAPNAIPAKSATFIAGIEVPGHGVRGSVNVEMHKDLALDLTEFGLSIYCAGNGRRMLVPLANLKAVYL